MCQELIYRLCTITKFKNWSVPNFKVWNIPNLKVGIIIIFKSRHSGPRRGVEADIGSSSQKTPKFTHFYHFK